MFQRTEEKANKQSEITEDNVVSAPVTKNKFNFKSSMPKPYELQTTKPSFTVGPARSASPTFSGGTYTNDKLTFDKLEELADNLTPPILTDKTKHETEMEKGNFVC